MFNQLYMAPVARARHCSGPLLEERLAFLKYLANQGYTTEGLRDKARSLLVITRMFGLTSRPRKALTLAEVKRKTGNHRRHFRVAIQWFQFMDRLQPQPAPLTRWAKKTKAFADYMKHDAELSPRTIYNCCWWVRKFLDRLHVKGCSLKEITPRQIDMALQKLIKPGGYSRVTVQSCATTIRAFFRFAETHGWCRKGLATSIWSPRVFSQTSVPLGPSWDDVRRLLTMTDNDKPSDIRARPILMLFVIYGLRNGEVRRLRLEDFDWEHEIFRVVSSKTGQVRTYPLTRSVGDAILRYLQEVRPRSPHRELFLSFHPPFRPVRVTLRNVVCRRLQSMHLSLPHYGPHALRHACAAQLLAAGLSLKEIGDQLGHTHPDSTRIYAKVDLTGLRQVADFDMGGVL